MRLGRRLRRWSTGGFILLYAELVEYEVGEKVKEVEYLGVYSTVGGVS